MPDQTIELEVASTVDVATNESKAAPLVDPRATLATWANSQDEWVRYIVRHILNTGTALSDTEVDYAYTLFRQE
jgi:hypothetical protein